MTLPLPLRRGPAVLLACLVVLIGATTLASAAETPEELREKRREVQEEAATLAVDVDALTDDVDELTAALVALRASVDAQQTALDGAERRVTAAEAAEAAAEARITDLEAQSARTEELLRQAAVNAYTGFQGPDTDLSVFTGNPWQQARTESLVRFGTGNTGDLIDELRAIGADLESERAAAAEHTAELEEQRSEVAARTADLEAAAAREEAALVEVESRLDARLGEAQALASLDAELAGEIEAEEQRIADAIAVRTRRNPSVSIPTNAPVDLATVRGIVVNIAIAQTVEGFLAAMEARGFPLGGGGYRSSDSQVALRRSNCGASDYAIWEMPSYQCSPPTARPGASAHEQGLAIDFTYQGAIIQDTGSAVFQTMSELAGGYGLYNLAGEPWHWSTTGN